jgi:hypothetical protein
MTEMQAMTQSVKTMQSVHNGVIDAFGISSRASKILFCNNKPIHWKNCLTENIPGKKAFHSFHRQKPCRINNRTGIFSDSTFRG